MGFHYVKKATFKNNLHLLWFGTTDSGKWSCKGIIGEK